MNVWMTRRQWVKRRVAAWSPGTASCSGGGWPLGRLAPRDRRGERLARTDSAPEAHQPLAEVEPPSAAWSDRPERLARRLLTASLVFSFLLQGCVHYRYGSFPGRAPAPPSEEVVQYFDYPKGQPVPTARADSVEPPSAAWSDRPEPTVQLLEETRHYRLKRIEFRFLLPEEMREKPEEVLRKEVEQLKAQNDMKRARDRELAYTIRIDYYESKEEGKRPLILVTPILGGVLIVDIFARFFARRGFSAAIIHQIRTRYDADKELRQVEDHLRGAAIRIRQALDWLLTDPKVDPERIGSFGISYGGIINTLVAAVEPRIRCHVIAMAGGPISEIIVTSREKPLRKFVKSAVQNRGYTPESLQKGLREAIRSEPMEMARYVDPEKVLSFIAYFDRVVKRRYAEGLWQTFGKPQMIYIPLGHYSSLLTLPYVENKALQFYRKKFYASEPQPGNQGYLVGSAVIASPAGNGAPPKADPPLAEKQSRP